jgi:hypothetical protein
LGRSVAQVPLPLGKWSLIGHQIELIRYSIKRAADADPSPRRRSFRRRRAGASPDYRSAFNVGLQSPPAPRSPVRPDLGEIIVGEFVPLLHKLVKATDALVEGVEELNDTIQGAEVHAGDISEQVSNFVRVQKAVVYNQLAQLDRAGAGRGFDIEEERNYVRVVETLTEDFDKDIEASDRLSDKEGSQVELIEGNEEARLASAKGDVKQEVGPKAQ